MNEITEPQRAIIAAMCAHIKQYGVAPTLNELTQAVGERHTTTVYRRLLQLVSIGRVVQWPDMARAYMPIEVYDAARDAAANLEFSIKLCTVMHTPTQSDP